MMRYRQLQEVGFKMEESKVIAIMEKYIEAAKQRKKVDGFLCSMLFFFYKDENENDLYGYRIEPVGFNMTSLEVKKEMQQLANRKAKDNKLLAVGFLEEVFYKPDVGESISSLSLDPESLNAIYTCVYFSCGSDMVQKTIFYKDFGEVQKPMEDPESNEVYNIIYVDQLWNSSQNPTDHLLINPFLETKP